MAADFSAAVAATKREFAKLKRNVVATSFGVVKSNATFAVTRKKNMCAIELNFIVTKKDNFRVFIIALNYFLLRVNKMCFIPFFFFFFNVI